MLNINQAKIKVAMNVMRTVLCADVKEKILIVTDKFTFKEAETFHQACLKMSCDVTIFNLPQAKRPLKDVPEDLMKLLKGKTIVLNIFRAYSEEIAFRIKWIFASEKTKRIRMGHMPGFTGAMFERMGNVDFSEMRKTAESLLKFLKDAVSLNITTAKGTDLSIGIKERKFLHDILIKKGQTGNIPCGEVYCPPEENKTDGVIVFDASIGDVGKLKTPLEIEIGKGRIKSINSKSRTLVNQIKRLTGTDRYANTIGELGIGINTGAKITGNMLEDEKSYGTAHLAFGNNEDFGGKNKAKIHRDFLFRNPTIEVTYKSGRKTFLMQKGVLLIN
jgi:leucyl aminopeptidase (aminopeptidase T)